ncbi:HET-domain-containing protein [Zopfia rhizophila CBS 207.26]|uniref:HET-domain-containing protein n=1 Tax=Zopfia rhizophila CBS 207.26 TaxID=1314779 RepID=A0A6A6EB84_9PEZI|nr:HET-domain-containing protein [Zopfia rhizophila CBS 207.26]
MRLLKLNNNGGFSLDTFKTTIPPYAILSHTWGSDSDEVTFKDVVDGTGKNKAGYQKLVFCGGQAKSDGLSYFWVDTCCIDKSNLNELTKAINSMFRWYQDAARCYVYLSDVSVRTQDGQNTHIEWESSFRNSRWFTRGWTLQELLAPRIVEFYSRDRVRLGDRKSFERHICDKTGIAIEALRGRSLHDFSVDEKFRWAERRQTTEEEDIAYCLLGIFDVFLPLIYGEGRKSAERRLRKEIEEPRNSKLPPPDRKSVYIMPFERNLRFIGRESELSRIEKLLSQHGQTTKVAITGLGGVGKTQLAIETVYWTIENQRDCSVFWIPATDPETLLQAYSAVAEELGIPGRDEQGVDVKRLVQNYLSNESAGQWLVVFDNADDMDMWMGEPSERQSIRLLDYLPKSRQGSILFTTRDRKVATKLASQNVVEVQEMNSEMALKLLQKCLIGDDVAACQTDTETLLAQLTYLPLAIVQAAAYINANGTSIADYLSLLDEQDESMIELLSEDFEDDGRYRNIKNPVATTWLISFERIKQRDPLAAEYLSFMACIEPKDIPQSLLPVGPTRKKEMDAIGTLHAYSFVIRRPADFVVDLHRLVHIATRNWLRENGQLVYWIEKAILRLEQVFPDDTHINRSIWRAYLPHVRVVLQSDLVQKHPKKKMDLQWRYGTCLDADGRWSEAEIAYSQVLEMEKKEVGVEHPSTLTSMANLASTFWNQGRWKEAEELEVQVMETFKRVLGAEHPSTLTSMANLASTFWNQGRWKEAEELEVQVMETFKRVLGAEHPSTLTSMANLASTFWDQGRWKEAEELDVQVMETFKRVLGAERCRSTADSSGMVNACVESFWNRVMETILSMLLGVFHPSLRFPVSNCPTWRLMMRVYEGRWLEAEALALLVMETLIHEFDSFLSRGQGRDEEAIKLMDKCVQLTTRVLGSSHPHTLSSLDALDS